MSAALKTQPHDRLRDLRERAGYETAADAARAMKVNVITYQHHENGRRAISRDAAESYAHFFGVAAGTILYGERLHQAQTVLIVGSIDAKGGVVFDAKRVRHVSDAPPGTQGADFVALTIDHDDLYPVYQRGDVVYYRSPTGVPPALAELTGLDCIVTLESGETLLGKLVHQHADIVTIVPYARPARSGVRVVSAQPIAWVQRDQRGRAGG